MMFAVCIVVVCLVLHVLFALIILAHPHSDASLDDVASYHLHVTWMQFARTEVPIGIICSSSAMVKTRVVFVGVG